MSALKELSTNWGITLPHSLIESEIELSRICSRMSKSPIAIDTDKLAKDIELKNREWVEKKEEIINFTEGKLLEPSHSPKITEYLLSIGVEEKQLKDKYGRKTLSKPVLTNLLKETSSEKVSRVVKLLIEYRTLSAELGQLRYFQSKAELNGTINPRFERLSSSVHGIRSYKPNISHRFVSDYLQARKGYKLVKVGIGNHTNYFISQLTTLPELKELYQPEKLDSLVASLFNKKLECVTNEDRYKVRKFLSTSLVMLGESTHDSDFPNKEVEERLLYGLKLLRNNLYSRSNYHFYQDSINTFLWYFLASFYTDIYSLIATQMTKQLPKIRPVAFSDFSFIYEVPLSTKLEDFQEQVAEVYTSALPKEFSALHLDFQVLDELE